MSKTEAEKWYKGSHYPLPYDDMITIQETDLFECLTDFANSQHLNLDVKKIQFELDSWKKSSLHRKKQIQQLTKERDELKALNKLNKIAKPSEWEKDATVRQLKEQLQAEKKKVEECKEYIRLTKNHLPYLHHATTLRTQTIFERAIKLLNNE